MSTAKQERAQAAELPENDVVAVLLSQHARIRDLFDAVQNGPEDRRQDAFHELRALLAVHETAEEMIVRPAARKVAGEKEAAARNEEEDEASRVLSRLEKLEFGSPQFSHAFSAFEESVSAHADHEEREEFPALRRRCSDEQRVKMGKRVLAVEEVAPTHPHPSAAGSTMAQWTMGPFASVLDRARDAVSSSGRR